MEDFYGVWKAYDGPQEEEGSRSNPPETSENSVGQNIF